VFVNVAVLKETQAHERRVALVPAVVAKLIKLGATASRGASWTSGSRQVERLKPVNFRVIR
jgi:alanine dehydrogenase